MAVQQRIKPPGNPFVARLASGQLPTLANSISGGNLNFDDGSGNMPAIRGNLVGKPGPGKVSVIDRVRICCRVSASVAIVQGAVGLRIGRLNSGNVWEACDLPFIVAGTALPANAEIVYDLPNFGLVLDGDNGTALVGNRGERLGAWAADPTFDIRVSITAFGRTMSRSEAIAHGDFRTGTAGVQAPGTGGWSSFLTYVAPSTLTMVPAVPGHCHIIRTLCMTATSDPANFDATRNVWLGTDTAAAIDPVEPIARLWSQTRAADTKRLIITGGNIVLPENKPIALRSHVASGTGGEAVFFGYETVPVSIMKDQDAGRGGAHV